MTQQSHKMEKLLLLMVMIVSCCATPQDLSGKVFVFPRESRIDHVKLLTSQTKFNSVTVCLRFLTDLTRNYALFSLAVPSHQNGFLIFMTNSQAVIKVNALNEGDDFLSLALAPNTWHSMCTTWRSDNGLAQVWLDGKASIKRFIKAQPITGFPVTILGQEQDSLGGGFAEKESFVGFITKLHMWDYVLSSAEIHRYMKDGAFSPGNVFNWRALSYEINGLALVEEESAVM